MPVLKIAGDDTKNPRRVVVVEPAHVLATEREFDVPLTTQSMLLIAREAQLQRMRVISVRLDDVNRLDDPELEELQTVVLERIRSGDIEAAITIILNWPTGLIITDLALRDSEAKTVLHLSRDGSISFGAGSTSLVKDRMQTIVGPHPEFFAS